MRRPLIICGLPPLLAESLSALVESSFPGEISVRISDSFQPSDNAVYIVGESRFIADIQSFIPRKEKVLVVGLQGAPAAAGVAPTVITLASGKEEMFKWLRRQLRERRDQQTEQGDLTARETEVLVELSKGLTIKEIASHLGISVNTVLTHRKNISSKLGIRSVSGLSLYAMMNGLL